MYDDINDRLEFKWQVKKDMRKYVQDTDGARDKLKADVKDWQEAGANVAKMYKAAWNYQMS